MTEKPAPAEFRTTGAPRRAFTAIESSLGHGLLDRLEAELFQARAQVLHNQVAVDPGRDGGRGVPEDALDHRQVGMIR